MTMLFRTSCRLFGERVKKNTHEKGSLPGEHEPTARLE
jgi:hypothetical protein